MAKQFDEISDAHRAFIEAQHIFFTGTAGPEGRVNISPKGMDSLRVLGPNRIIWLNPLEVAMKPPRICSYLTE